MDSWMGMFVPANTPPAIVTQLNTETAQDHRQSGDQGEDRRAGLRGVLQHARGARRVRQGPARQMDQDDQGRRHRAGVIHGVFRRSGLPVRRRKRVNTKAAPSCRFAPAHLKGLPVSRSKACVGEEHAAEPPTARRAARHLARARRGEIRRGFLLREVRRHPRAGDGDAGGPAAALAQGPGARLGHGRIRHAAARHLGAHAPRGIGRQAERPHHRDPAADRAQPARGARSSRARRAADHRRLRRDPGRRRNPHRRHHRRLGRAVRLHHLDEDARDGEGRAAARPRRRRLLRHLQRHAGARSRLRRGLPRPTPTPISS